MIDEVLNEERRIVLEEKHSRAITSYVHKEGRLFDVTKYVHPNPGINTEVYQTTDGKGKVTIVYINGNSNCIRVTMSPGTPVRIAKDLELIAEQKV